MGEGSTRSPMRERFREQVRDDVKVAALVQLAEGGPAAVSVNVTTPAVVVDEPNAHICPGPPGSVTVTAPAAAQALNCCTWP